MDTAETQNISITTRTVVLAFYKLPHPPTFSSFPPSLSSFSLELIYKVVLISAVEQSDSIIHLGASQVALVVKSLPASAGDSRDAGSIPGSGRCPGGGNGNPFQRSCLGNPMDRGAWRVTVLGAAELDTT